MMLLKKLRPLLPSFFWLWLLFILILMIIPANGISLYDFPGRDKLIHFCLFAVLGFFFVFTKQSSKGIFRIKKRNWGTYLLILFSLSVEVIHTQLSYRSFELFDSLSNGLGTIAGIIIGQIIFVRIMKFLFFNES